MSRLRINAIRKWPNITTIFGKYQSSLHIFIGPLALALACILLPTAVAETANLVRNGEFKENLKHWKIKFTEPNETKYSKNHESVNLVADVAGAKNALQFRLTPAVAASQGVKAVTELIPVAAGQTYEFGCSIRSLGPSVKIILEGYKEAPERKTAGADQYPGFKRIYRAVIHPRNLSQNWSEHKRTFTPPPRYQPTHVLIKLYAYLGQGNVFFKEVFLRNLSNGSTATIIHK